MLDAMSETLRAVHLTGAIFNDRQFVAPWCYASSSENVSSVHRKTDSENVVKFYMVITGECFVEQEGQAPLHLRAGDAVVFPQGGVYRMGSKPGLAADPVGYVSGPLPSLVYGQNIHNDSAKTRLICGYLSCDARLARMLLAGLPPVVRVNVRAADSGPWLEASLQYALSESRSPRPGGAGVAMQKPSCPQSTRTPRHPYWERPSTLA
mgnify:CR=1 FL=1